jgi:hypothetical protein
MLAKIKLLADCPEFSGEFRCLTRRMAGWSRWLSARTVIVPGQKLGELALDRQKN